MDNFTGLTTSYPSSPSSSSVCVAPVTNFRAVGSEPSDCFITCEFVTVQDILNNFHPRNTRSPPEVSSSLRVVTNLESACHLGLCTVIHSGGVPKQGQTQCLNDFSECRMIGSPLYFIIGDKVVLFNSMSLHHKLFMGMSLLPFPGQNFCDKNADARSVCGN